MSGADVPAAWWIFWLALGVIVFCGLIWTFYRFAVWSDEATWREFVERRADQEAVTRERERTIKASDL
ncbi:MAG TPA: hypothetical protein VFZ85_03205 [Jiangellaceae bacterium]